MPVDRDMAAAKSANGKKSDNKVFMGTQGVSGPYRAVIADIWLRYTDAEGYHKDGNKRPYTSSRGDNPGTMQKCKFVFELEGRNEVLDYDMAVLFGEKSNYTKVAGWFGSDVHAFDPEACKGLVVDIFVDCQEKVIAAGSAGAGSKYWWSKVVGCKAVNGAPRAAEAPPVDTRQAVEDQAERLAQQAAKQEKLAVITRLMRVLNINSKAELDGRLLDLCDDISHFNGLPGAHNTLGAYSKDELARYVESLERGAAEAQARSQAAPPAQQAAAPAQRAERPTGGISSIQLSVITTMFEDLLKAGKIKADEVEQIIGDVVTGGELKAATTAEAKTLLVALKELAASTAVA